MPAAPNDLVLLNFEENIEKAVAAVILALDLPAMKTRDGEETPPMSVNIQFTLGEATGTKAIRPGTVAPGSAPRLEYSEFLGVLEIQVEANRPDVGASGTAGIEDAFNEARAKIRAAFMESNWPLNDSNLPYYRLSLLRPAGTVNGTTHEESDTGLLRYNVKFSINKDAWPVAS